MRMLSNDDLSAIGTIVDQKLEPVLEAVRDGFEAMEAKFMGELKAQEHGLMDHTDRTVAKAVGDLRVELKGDMTELRTELKGDMRELRTELKDVKAGIEVVKEDIGGLRSELRERHLIA